MRHHRHRSTLNAALLLGILLTATRFASAQAIISAERGAEIAPFAQTTLIGPDYGQTHNLGYAVGFDYTRFIRSIVQPSLEFRYTSANGATVNERAYTGGLKLQTTIHRVHPYATILVGHGNIDFAQPTGSYAGDNAFVYSLGGGADFRVTSVLKVRADFTSQHWSMDPNTLTPVTLGLGIAYVVPFHSGRVQ